MASYLRSWWFGTNTREPSDDSQIPSGDDPLKTPTLSSSSTPSLSTSHDSGVVDADPAKPPAVSISVSIADETRADVDSDERTPVGRVLKDVAGGNMRRQYRAQPQRKTDAELMPPPSLPAAASALSSSSNAASPEVDDTPPMFPIPSSIQRLNVSSRSDAEPPSTPRPRKATHDKTSTSSLMPPSAPGTRLLPPPAATGGSSSALLVPSSTKPGLPSRRRAKVALAPGHSPLDWAALKTSGTDLRGVSSLMRITPSQLKRHNTREDAWSSFNGKVYNITPYLPFHPGGDELMRVAGRDGTKLFTLTHAWVNLDIMLDECLVGFLVPETSSSSLE